MRRPLGSARMDVEKIAPGLWRWTASHPEWTPDEDWPQQVGCIDYVLARYSGAQLRTAESNDPLPAGIEAYPVERADETLFWIVQHRALVSGDVLLGSEAGGVRVCPDSWLPKDFRGEEFRASLGFLLELPVEMVLASHGEPVLENGREALTAALTY